MDDQVDLVKAYKLALSEKIDSQALLSCFWRGLPLDYLGQLLDSTSLERQEVGIYLVDEMVERGSACTEKVERFCQFEDKQIRYSALEAIGSSLTLDNAFCGRRLLNGAYDSDEQCRKIACISIMQLDTDVYLRLLDRIGLEDASGFSDAIRLGQILRSAFVHLPDWFVWADHSERDYRLAGLLLAGRCGEGSLATLGHFCSRIVDDDLRTIAKVQMTTLGMRQKHANRRLGRLET